MGLNIAPILMFVFLMLSIGMGIHIAFALTFVSVGVGYFFWGPNVLFTVINSAWGSINNFSYIAIPLFIFMALMLQKSQVVADLYNTFYKWSGPLRGGLAVATIIVGAVVAAMSGVTAAGVVGLGLIALPEMLKNKYDKFISAGSIMTGGTLGQIIPPSLNMVVYGAVTGVPVASLFAGGITAGLLIALFSIIYILIRSYVNKDLCPALPLEKRASWKEKFSLLKSIIVPIGIVVIVIGAILTGLATPTEGAGIGALAAIIFSIVSKRFSWKVLWEASIDTLKLTGMIVWIIIGAKVFGSVFAGVGGNQLIRQIAAIMPGGRYGVLLLSILFVLILGMFIETVAQVVLAGPLLSTLLISYGFNPLWWAIIFNTLAQVAFLSPPFGFSLFYLKGVAPKEISMRDIYKAAIPFLIIQLAVVLFLVLFPKVALWLPLMLR